MGSSSSIHRLGHYYSNLEFDDLIKYENCQVTIQVHGMKINQKPVIVVHHGICFVINSSQYYLYFQWGKQGHDMYLAKYQQNYLHQQIGQVNFKDFKQALVSVTFNRKYDALRFNCNHYTEQILKKLNFKKFKTIRFDCPCITDQTKLNDPQKLKSISND